MKNTLTTTFGFVLLFIAHIANSQTVQWARRGVSQGYEYGNAIAVDDVGDAYISGQIEYTTNFDGVSLTAYGIHDIFVGKYGADGSIKWLRHAGSPAGDVAYGVGVDAAHNCYVSGEVEQTSNFGSGFTVTSSGSNDVFLAKYDVNGVVTRLQRWGSPGNDKSRALKVSPSGECYLTGYYSDGMSFGSVSLSHAGGNDVYITKVSASGTVLWAKRGGGSNDDRGYGIAYDNSGNVFVSGYFNSSATFSGTTISNNGVYGAFLAKYDSNGNFQWIKKGGSNSEDAEANCVAVDENGYIYSAGYYRGTATFGSTTLTSVGSTDIFIVKYDHSGNVVWAKSAGGAYEDIAYGLTIDTNSHQIYMTGQIDNNAYFGSIYVGGAGNRDVMIATYDMNGNPVWVKAYGGNQRDIGYAIAHDNNGNIFTTGIYNDNATFGSTVLDGYLLSDFYIEKTSPAPAPQPTTQSSSLAVVDMNCSDLELTFTPGNGARRIIIARATSAVSANPVDGNTYNASSTFGSGSNLGSGNYVVYDGTGNDLILTGLTPGTIYYFKIFEYNGTSSTTNYLTTSPASASGVAGSLTVAINAATNEMCVGDSILLTGQGASTYNWAPSFGLSSATGNTVYAFPATTTTYTVTGTDSRGCQSQSSITITVNSNPVVSFTTPAAVCQNGSPVTLTGGIPAGGIYSGIGITGNVFSPSLAGVGTFSLQYIYTNSNGCTGSAQAGITVNPLPTITVSPFVSVCENAVPFALTNASPAGGNYSGTGVSANFFDPALAGPGTFLIQYTYSDLNGCENSAQFNVGVNALPVVTFSTVSSICEDASSVLLSNVFPSGGVFSGTGVSGNLFEPAVAGVGTFVLQYDYTDANGCANSAQTSITVNSLPVITFSGTTSVCENSNAFALTNASPAGGLYTGTGMTAGVFDPAIGSGNYLITYEFTDGFGCTSADDFNMQVNPIPSVYLGADTVICADNSIVLDAGAGFAAYQWSNGSVGSSISVDSAGVGIGTTTLAVLVADANGCVNSDSLNVTFDLCAGIDFVADNFNDVSVYPNPFEQSFNFVSGKTVAYFVYDALGQLIEFNASFSGQKTLGEAYIPGVYFVKVFFKAERKVYRLVKLHE